MIHVDKVNDTTYKVTVEQATTTEHEVTVAPDYYEKLTDGAVTAEELVRESFKFLLEREANTSILRHFDLPVIGRYFPEYEREIKKRLG
ncbi:MAG: hypothetical protein GWO02_00610 [Gammaproteobacteria bacterium]|nr:hypothetical protein [Gammaproteobacteria bacterium]